MILNNESTEPIYLQIARWLEDEILSGRIGSDEKIYSQYQLAEIFHINPATAAKGISLLLDEGLVYQKRGLGTFLQPDAREKIRAQRIAGNLNQMIDSLLVEAEQLGISSEKLLALIDDKIAEADGKIELREAKKDEEKAEREEMGTREESKKTTERTRGQKGSGQDE